jgi:LDH2 family malate/lactate/ureidoglycolate dehydrogenase
VPTGGTLPVLGTNPLAFAAPRRNGEPFVIDMSTSVVAMNKVRIYGVAGKALPEGWVIESSGSPVAEATLVHELLTTSKAGLSTLGGPDTILGGHKGLGLSHCPMWHVPGMTVTTTTSAISCSPSTRRW